MRDRRRPWWNSRGFESKFRRRQVVRVVAFAMAYVAISTLCMGAVYAAVLGPLTRGEMPVVLKLDLLRDIGGIPGLGETLVLWLTLMTSLSLVFAFAVGLHFSHTLAGPLHRIKLELRRLGDGEPLREVSLRKGDDDYADVAEVLNHAVERLQADALESQQRVELAEARLAELCEGVLRQARDPEALRRLVEKASQPD
jgi:hypothetical protein